MNILLITNHEHGNDGWSRYAINLRDALIERDHTVNMIYIGNPLAFLTRPWKGWMLAHQLKRGVILRGALRPIHRSLGEGGSRAKDGSSSKDDNINITDIIHFAVEPSALALLFLPKKLRKKTVLTIHGNYGIRPFRFWMTRFFWPIVLKRVMKIVTVSNYTKEAVARELKKKKMNKLSSKFLKKVTVIHNGIPIQVTRNAQRVKRNKKTILHIGGIRPAKGLGKLIEACAIYKEHHNTKFQLHIIGKEPHNHYQDGIENLIKEKKLCDHVHFSGKLSNEELQKEYQHADLLAVPSYTTETCFEGFGLVYIEANSHGVSVIGPNTSGAAEAIKDGVSGYTVNVCNSEEIADRIHDVFEGKIKADECRKWAEEHNIASVARKVENVYKILTK